MRKYCLSLLLLFLTLVSNAVEPPKREIRGVWLTTVYGLDWPHNPATTETGRKAQQRDVCDILDRLQDANFILFFCRSVCVAMSSGVRLLNRQAKLSLENME